MELLVCVVLKFCSILVEFIAKDLASTMIQKAAIIYDFHFFLPLVS